MALLNADQIEQLSSLPIPGNNPAGTNIRLEPGFEAIELELSKLDSFTQDDPVAWARITETAKQVLMSESKDFLVACFLTRSLCETDLIGGLNQGILITKGLVESFWEDAYPPKKRIRGRSQAFEWLVEKCQPLLEGHQPDRVDLERIKDLESNLSVLDELLLNRMAQNAPNFSELRSSVHRISQSLETDHQSSDKVAPAGGGNAPSQPSTHDLPVEVTSRPSGTVSHNKDVMVAYRLCQEQLDLASQFLANKNPLDPERFRINRFITWLGVNQLPPSVESKTQLRPPSQDRLDHYQSLYREQRWLELVAEIEKSLVRAPYWFDGQRMVAEALKKLDASIALGIVQQAARDFFNRFPGIIDLKFSDDSCFVNEKTKFWLQGLNRASSIEDNRAALIIDTTGISAEWEESYAQANGLADENKIREALALFQAGVSRSTSLREQALWRFNQARFCSEQGLTELAMPLLEDLDGQMIQMGIEEWEPNISKHVLELLIRCYFVKGVAEENLALLERYRARLCKLDLALAFDLSVTNSK
jgi:type VI secretion system protein VasJ